MIDYEQLGRFYLGREHAPDRPAEARAPILYDARDLTTHAVCVGMTGSGKTGLCIDLLEEAALDGIPAIAIDPKGDIADLALTFPELRPADFRPWIDEQEAARRGIAPDALAAEIATRWREGLADWGQGPDRIRRLREAAEVRLYTPGSDAGRSLAVLESFAPPAGAAAADADATRERIASLVSGLLSLLGLEADPIQSREHILLATLIEHVWARGEGVGLETLIRLVERPPVERIGVVDVETFFPAADRVALAMRLNALVAAPGFAAWLRGDPLDAGTLLHGPDGRPRISVISIAHLGDRERMFVVTLILGAVLAWMRRQAGSSSLRAILYMDEVLGFLPPVAAPPSKAPLLTLLKQARAYGLGVVLATQNPVDLDYKALGNAGTWLIGRLQTTRDRERLLDGLTGAGGAGGGLDRQQVGAMLGRLEPRVFLLHDVHEDAPVLMESRWALSYLRGPLTPAEIRRLTGPGVAPPAQDGAAPPLAAAPAPGGAAPRPVLEPGVEEVFLAPPAGAAAGRYEPELLATVHLHFVQAAAGLDVWRTERVLVPWAPDGTPQWDRGRPATAALESAPRPGWALAAPPGAATRAGSYPAWSRAAADHVHRTAREVLWTCAAPKAVSASGETEAEFRARLAALAREERDAEVERLRARYAPKLARLDERIRRAEERALREAGQWAHERTQTLISVGTTVLGALFGRKLGSARTVGRAGTAARAASRAARERDDVARARERVEEERAKLGALDAELETALARLRAPIDPRAFVIEPLEVPPRKGDLRVERLALAWVPA